ncbi:MAG: DUF3854 domain-containing protein [Dehalococcoidia bacterium]
MPQQNEPLPPNALPLNPEPGTQPLLPQHAALLSAAALSPAVIEARGYRSVTEKADLQRLGFGDQQYRVPGLLIPVWDVHGRHILHQFRPDQPRSHRGKPFRYEVPNGVRAVLDVPPPVRTMLADLRQPLFVTIGVRQADAAASQGFCAIALLGIWGWAGRSLHGPAVPLSDWQNIPLTGRPVYLAFDSVNAVRPDGRASLAEIKAFLESRQAVVQFIHLPPDPSGAKTGLDDYLAAGHSLEDLLRLASSDLPTSGAVIVAASYRATPDGLFRETFRKDQVIWHQLTNFRAVIRRQFLLTDGIEQQRFYEIEAVLRDITIHFTLPAEEFEAMDWVFTHLGAGAIVSATFGDKHHARAAIQQTSGDAISTDIVYSHLGWLRHEGEWRYVHADGIIGPEDEEPPQQAGTPTATPPPPHGPGGAREAIRTGGADPGAETGELAPDPDAPNLFAANALPPEGSMGPISAQQTTKKTILTQLPPALAHYQLPHPPSGEGLVAAIQASLRMLNVAPDRITLPLYASIWCSALETADFGVHVSGKSGLGKTELAALPQQHFGPAMSSRNLPGSWSSTANALEAIAFLVKDALFTVDDFIPRGSPSDVERTHRDADRLFRSQGNRSGRARCQRDGTVKEGKPPRGLILSTGEDIPTGLSLNARILNIQLRNGDVNWAAMSTCQLDARQGWYAQAMAGFLRWLAPRRDRLLAEKREQVEHFREVFTGYCRHPRTVSIAADLLAGLEVFLEFALEKRAIMQEEFDDLWRRYHEVMESLLKDQDDQQDVHDPVECFLALLAGVLLSGGAHVAATDGGPPDWYLAPGSLPAWGWAEETIFIPKSTPAGASANPSPSPTAGDAAENEWEPRTKRWPKGQRVGWIVQEDLYLEPAVCLAIVQRLARDCGQFLALTPRTLGKCLATKGLLVRRDEHRNRYTVRKNIQGRRSNFLYLHASAVLSKEWMACDFLEPGHEGPMDSLLDA